MRASRLLTIQMLLQSRGRMSAPALAQALEVSLRTLHRDMDELSAAGVPIYAERGRTGGFALMDGWKTTLTGLTASEAQAVFLTGLAGPAAQLGLGAPAQDAQLKLLAALPSSQRQDAQRWQERFHLDPVDWYRESEPTPHLQAVADAVWRSQKIRVQYESWRGASRQVLSPLGLVLKAGVWYLIAVRDARDARDASKPEPRTYRVSSMEQVSVLDEPAKGPKRFDLEQYWKASIARFERELYTLQATVLATPAGLQHLRYLSAAVAKAVSHTINEINQPALSSKRKPVSTQQGKRLHLIIPIESLAHAARQLLPLAPEVEVIAPTNLRVLMREHARRWAQIYDENLKTKPAIKSLN
jgi:predicted DNA-binding transcriptional regulator YafY